MGSSFRGINNKNEVQRVLRLVGMVVELHTSYFDLDPEAYWSHKLVIYFHLAEGNHSY